MKLCAGAASPARENRGEGRASASLRRRARIAPALVAALLSVGPARAQSSWSERWVYASENNGDWRPTPTTTALGFHGTQALAMVGPFVDETALLSSFDSGAATPAWEFTDAATTLQHRVAGASDAPTFATLHTELTNDPFGLRDARVRILHAASPIPVREWSFPFRTNGHESLFVGVSRDGERVVAAAWDIFATQGSGGETMVAVSQGAAPFSTSRIALPGGGGFSHASLSADGRRLFVATGFAWGVVDTASGALLQSAILPFGYQLDDAAFSADGDGLVLWGARVVGTGLEGELLVLRRDPLLAAWTLRLTIRDPQTLRCAAADLSSDATLLVAGFDFGTLDRVRVTAWDLDAGTTVATQRFSHDVFSGNASLQEYVTDLDLAPDGGTIAVGLAGDGDGNPSPELLVFEAAGPLPVASFDLRGSVHSVELVNGFLLVSNKSAHYGEFAGGGDLRLFGRARDLDFRGIPHAGVLLAVEARGALAGSFARTLFSADLPAAPWSIGVLGTLYPDRTMLASQPIGDVSATGTGTGTFRAPLVPGAVRHAQGLFTGPRRRLTVDWLPVMALP